MRLWVSLLTCSLSLCAFDLEYNLENSNILMHAPNYDTIDYNRLRLNLDLYADSVDGLEAKVIVDNSNYFAFETHDNHNETDVYRAYLSYATSKHYLTLGLQRIPFGVGRITNPIDIFNPIDITAIETDQREGTRAFRYEYTINDLSTFDLTFAHKRQAIRVKGFLEVADVAGIIINDEKNNQEVYGYELEGEMGESQITFRSEGGLFWDKTVDTTSYHYMVGGEYGFENGLIVICEYAKHTREDISTLSSLLSYVYSPLTTFGFLVHHYIEGKNTLLAPTLSYSLSDESTLDLGYFHYSQSDQDLLYLRYFINF